MKHALNYIFVFFIVVFGSNLAPAISQDAPELDARKAVYTRVNSFTALSISDPDTVFVEDVSGFSVGDTVLYFQTIGATENDGGDDVEDIFYTGKYGIMKIEEIPNATTIVFNSRLPYMFWISQGRVNEAQSGEIGQLVKVPVYDDVRVTSAFATDNEYWDWDPVSQTGGIFPVIAGKLILETDFSADNQGFKGAEPDGEYGGVCSGSSGDIIYETEGEFTESADSSGRKGESFNVRSYPFTKGFANIATGGGGGNGKYSGGGGGANFGGGSRGGYESIDCGTDVNIGGRGGFPVSFNNNTTSFTYNRIYLGGGGGTGTQNPGSNRFATRGGNGGGILIILADTIIGNDNKITANGESITSLATAGAGGGGGGGVIMIDAGYVENTTFEARGGDGGDVSTANPRSGPGGGGGGGLIAYNDNILLPFPKDVSEGQTGEYDGSTFNGAESAGEGETVNGVTIPIRGFIINPLSEDQVICENDIPELFNAAKPKGGDGVYSYQWLISTSEAPETFTEISGADQMTYQHPTPLTQTTFFKRRVTSAGVTDETFYITVEVTPAIENNSLASPQTICSGLVPATINGSSEPLLTGGDGTGTYEFSWESRTDDGNWNLLSGETGLDYLPGTLTDTTFIRRIVNSGVCENISDSVEITVLPNITNNAPASPQDVYCNAQTIQPITTADPSGGDDNFIYQWELKIGEGPWTDDATSRDYPASTLNANGTEAQTYQLRRTVFSGPSNTCEDQSPEITLTVLPDIVNNNLTVNQDTLCANLPGTIINGTEPGGGNGIPYTFLWQTSTDGTSGWTDGSGESTLQNYQTASLSNSLYFRRIVTDGTGGVCSDTSSSAFISVIPVISDNIISSDQEQCEGETPEALTGLAVSGGDNEYLYDWEFQKESEGSWVNLSADGEDFSPGVLDEGDNYFYRRIVYSGENNTCTDTSNQVRIHVEAGIQDNTPDALNLAACFNSEITIGAAAALGGDNLTPAYTWEDSIDGGSWSIAPEGFGDEDYINSALNRNTWYRRIAVSQTGLCTSMSDIVKVDTLTLPVLVELTANADTICDDSPFVLYPEFESNFYGPFEIEFTNGTESNVVQDVSDSIYFERYNRPFEGFNFQVTRVTDINNCTATGNYSTVLPLWVNDAPSPRIIISATPFETCGPVFELEADPDNNPGVSSGWWRTGLNSDLAIDSPNSERTSFTLAEGFNNYTDTIFYYQSTARCGARADSLIVNMYEQPEEPSIYRGEQAVIYIIDSDTLQATEPSAGSFAWSLESEGAEIEDPLNNPVMLKNIPLDEQTVLRYTVSNGVCEPKSALITLERREVHVFEGISPENQDGLNDYLVAEGLDTGDATFTFQLFSNSGLLVREIKSEDIGELGFDTGLPNNGLELWDGKDRNGNNYVTNGTYYYVLTIDYKGVEFIDRGFVVVR